MATTKRDLILETALDLFVKQGISDTSTASIAKAAGVATGTLFHHFANKQAIVDGLYRDLKEKLANYMNNDQPELDMLAQAQHYWLACLQCFICNTQALKFFQLYYSTPSIEHDSKFEILKETFGFFFEFIAHAKREGQFIDVPEDYIVFHCQQALFTTAQFLIDHPEHQNKGLEQQSFELNFNSLLVKQPNIALAQVANQ